MPQTENHLPRLTPEQRRAAAGQYERANQVLAKGDYDYALPLLLNCCLIDPGNAVYRQVLRQATKTKYNNNLRGQKLSFLANARNKLNLRRAVRVANHLKVLEHGERILMRNPWDVPAHLAMAVAFEELGLGDMAVWTLEQARQIDPNSVSVNRPLARLYERRGNFNQAIALWQLVRKAAPQDVEAQTKAKDIAASATIAKGRYEQALSGEAPSPFVQGLAGETSSEQEGEPPSDETSSERVREAPAIFAKIKANPTNPANYLQLAQLYRRLDMFDKAREVLQQGIQATGNHFDLAMEIVDLDIEPFRRDLAITEDKLRRDAASAASAELQKIKMRLVKEIGTRELSYFQQKVDRVPSDSTARFEMALRLMRTGQVDEAIKEFQSLRTDPRHQSKVLVYLGFCFKGRNNWRLAQRNFEEALQHLTPADEGLRKEVLYQLASGYAEAREFARAVDLACELANLDFGYKNISELLDQWQARLQKA